MRSPSLILKLLKIPKSWIILITGKKAQKCDHMNPTLILIVDFSYYSNFQWPEYMRLFLLIRKIKNLPWIRHLLYSKVPDLLLNISYRLYCLFLKHLGKKFLSSFYKETGLENLSLEIVSTRAKTWTQSCLSAIPTPKTCALSTPQLSLTDNISYLHPELCLWQCSQGSSGGWVY